MLHVLHVLLHEVYDMVSNGDICISATALLWKVCSLTS